MKNPKWLASGLYVYSNLEALFAPIVKIAIKIHFHAANIGNFSENWINLPKNIFYQCLCYVQAHFNMSGYNC